MSYLFDLIVSIVGLGVLAATIWAVRSHFVSTEMRPKARLISATVILNAVVLLYLTWTVAQPLWAQLAGLVPMIGGGVMFFATIAASKEAGLRFAYDPEKPQSLLETGPYRWVRHPFYVSYILLWTGWAIAAWSLWTLPLFALLLWLYVDAALMEEGNFADTPMAESYAEYKSRAGFFWPKFPVRRAEQRRTAEGKGRERIGKG